MDVGNVKEYPFTVVTNEPAAKGIYRMVFSSDVAACLAPGQFMNFSVPGDGAHILRIPLSFAHADGDACTVEILYAVVGEGTRRLSMMRPQQSASLLGPCGKGWRLPQGVGRALLVAGGIGLPPVSAAARMLANAGIGFDVVVGARTYAMHVIPDVEALSELGTDDGKRVVLLTTDDGTTASGSGRGRYATDGMAQLLEERDYVQVYTCGPNVMMAGVAKLARERGISCQVSMERMMGCGFGACACCNVPLASGGYALCCQDGPVFDAEEVAW